MALRIDPHLVPRDGDQFFTKAKQAAARQDEAVDLGAVRLGDEVADFADILTLAVLDGLADDGFRHAAVDGRDMNDLDLGLARSLHLDLRRSGFDPDLRLGGTNFYGALSLNDRLGRLRRLGLGLGGSRKGGADQQGRRKKNVYAHDCRS